jgi:hypothetical protein
VREGAKVSLTKEDLVRLVEQALQTSGGSSTIVDVCKYVWEHHEDELLRSGSLFYTWQYDIRWAAHSLRMQGRMRPVSSSPKGVWELARRRTRNGP